MSLWPKRMGSGWSRAWDGRRQNQRDRPDLKAA